MSLNACNLNSLINDRAWQARLSAHLAHYLQGTYFRH